MLRHITTGFLVNDEDSIEFPVEFMYDVSDPLIISVTFHPGEGYQVPWVVGRDLFIEAFEDGLAGEPAGDVQIALVPSGNFLSLRLCSPDGAAIVNFQSAPVYNFIQQTAALMPPGREFEVGVDEAIERLLNEAS